AEALAVDSLPRQGERSQPMQAGQAAAGDGARSQTQLAESLQLSQRLETGVGDRRAGQGDRLEPLELGPVGDGGLELYVAKTRIGERDGTNHSDRWPAQANPGTPIKAAEDAPLHFPTKALDHLDGLLVLLILGDGPIRRQQEQPQTKQGSLPGAHGG